MTDQTRQMFLRVGKPPEEKDGHEPLIQVKGSTLIARCSCGKRLGGGRGCNRGGIDYGILYAKQAYERHL